MPRRPARDAKDPSVGVLQPVLADLVALSLEGKQAHWAVTGPRFLPLHEALDGFVAAWRDAYDEVAERVRALRGVPDGRPAAVARAASGFPEGAVPDDEVVRWALERLEGVAGRLRSAIEALADRDPVSQDLLIGIAHTVEKQAWMLRAQR